MCKFVNNTKHSRIDKCMINLIGNLNQLLGYIKKGEYKTVACCCGHKKYPISIIIQWGVKDYFVDIVSDISVPRKRNFYMKDKEGLYYIPELWGFDDELFSKESIAKWKRKQICLP